MADTLTDLAPLLQPIPGPHETGEDISLDRTMREIEEARRAENARLPQGIWTHDLKRADWPLTERLCTEALSRRSKDVQIAAYLTEAWLQQRGPRGLGDGLRLLAALARRFWPGLHPAVDGDDLGARLAAFEWLNGRVPVVLRDQPIVRAAGDPPRTATWTDYVNAQLLEGLRQRDARSFERAEAGGSLTLAGFSALREATEVGFFRSLDGDLSSAATALAQLNGVLEELCGRDAPALGGISSAIEDIRGLLAAELRTRRQVPAIPPVTSIGAAVAPPAPAASGEDAPPTRGELYAQLAGIAEALQTMEPHSPVPYLLRSAIAWGELPLPDLVTHFAAAGFDIGSVFALLGLDGHVGSAQPQDLQSDAA